MKIFRLNYLFRFFFFIRFSMSIFFRIPAAGTKCQPYKRTASRSSCDYIRKMVGPSGLEPPTSCLSGTRSNLLSYEPLCLWSPALWVSTLPTTDGKQNDFPFPSAVGVSVGLSSRTVARTVFSPPQSLTSVFGMGTGGPSAFETLTSQGCRSQGFRKPLCAFPLPLRVPASLSRLRFPSSVPEN